MVGVVLGVAGGWVLNIWITEYAKCPGTPYLLYF